MGRASLVALVLSMVAVLPIAGAANATTSLTVPQDGSKPELLVTADSTALGTTISNGVPGLLLPSVDDGQVVTSSIQVQASISGAIVNPTTAQYSCYFWNGSAASSTSGAYALRNVSTNATTTTCDIVLTGMLYTSGNTSNTFYVGDPASGIGGVQLRIVITPPTLTVSVQPSVTVGIDGSLTVNQMPTWSGGAPGFGRWLACPSQLAPATVPTLSNLGVQCSQLRGNSSGQGIPTNLNSAYYMSGFANFLPVYSPYSEIASTRPHIVYEAQSQQNYVHTGTVQASIGPATGPASTQESAQYSGPEFSSLSLKPVMHGSSTTLTGKRLTQVSSIEIGGKAATFTATSDTELSLTPAADLAPGTYDLVINSAAGKLTHINAVRIQAALRSFSVTTRAENRITEEQYQEHSLIASIQQAELTKARCIVNGPNLAQAKAQAERLCALVKAANPNIATTVIDPRSTVKNNTVFARVTYGWN